MVYTVTLNPSIDYVVYLEEWRENAVNRTRKEEIIAGGKGINVSQVLTNLGIENMALGFVAGFTGEEIEKRVKESGCNTNFIHIQEGCSRINVKMKHRKETEINGQGPVIKEKHMEELRLQVEQVTEGDYLVLAGSIPKGLPNTTYETIIKIATEKKCMVVVDTTKESLMNALPYHPFLIKPNHHELSEIFGVTIESREDIICYAKKLQQFGARNVLVSRASDGAILLTEGKGIYELKAPVGEVVNSVGAGDSMVAGFITGYQRYHQYEEALRLGIAAGSASAFSDHLATKEEVEVILPML